eukprot:CAMPEP_0172388998 /NCGR_PEP_ID=MMETSP1061-20121228/5989_1 /TAXON_ID=37318 /ORGANISM="Pseudo-nitzschia pungens, Strain cf. pungens" /LENGTH=602 /DNA_ID=CAMNT_0013119035 /DNA_START=592 /DNA_END=2400 /DNA_ORIENTATION=-
MTAGEIETAVGEAADAIAPTDSVTDDHSSNGYEGNDSGNDNDNGNTLSLHDVWLGPVVAEELVRLIRTCPDWDSISLQNCSGDARLCHDLYLTCTTHPRLRSLSLRHAFKHPYRPTPVETIQTLVYGIRYNARLETLDLQGLRLDASLANLISRALVRNTTLLRLGLRETFFVATTTDSDNEDQKNGAAQILSFGLRFNRTIESLNLDRCKPLADEDLACLLNAVNSNDTVLRELSLQYTPCHEESMKAVALLLQENVIEDLDLSYLERKRKRPKAEESEPEDKDESETNDEDDKKQQEESDEPDSTEPSNDESEQDSESAPESKPDDSNANADETSPTQESSSESRDPDPQGDDGGGGGGDDSDNIVNTSLKRLAMVGNGLDDDYLESLMGIFAPRRPGKIPSRLEELSLYGNRFSNHGVKILLKRLPRFPFLQRLYLGFQQPPLPELFLPLALRNSNHPSLRDRTTRFQPGLLTTDFVRAVVHSPENFRLTEVHILTETPGDEALQRSLRYHTKLNEGGRRILACCTNATSGSSSAESVPLGIWPLVLDRANRLYPLPSPPPSVVANVEKGGSSRADDDFHAGDLIYCLLHGPMVFENLD